MALRVSESPALGRVPARRCGNGVAFEHQLRLVRRHGTGVPDGLLREIRRDVERDLEWNGQVP